MRQVRTKRSLSFDGNALRYADFSSEKFVVLGRIYYLCITALTNMTTHHEQTDDATDIAAGPAAMGTGNC